MHGKRKWAGNPTRGTEHGRVIELSWQQSGQA